MLQSGAVTNKLLRKRYEMRCPNDAYREQFAQNNDDNCVAIPNTCNCRLTNDHSPQLICYDLAIRERGIKQNGKN